MKILAPLLLCGSLCAMDAPRGVTSPTIGLRFVEDDAWGNLDQWTTFGLNSTIRAGSQPIGIILNWSLAQASDTSDGIESDLDAFDVQLGVGYFGQPDGFDRLLLSAGAGIQYTSVQIDLSGLGGSATIDDSGFGAFLALALHYRFTDHIGAGLHAGWSYVALEDTANGVEFEADTRGFSLGASVGFAW